MQTMHPVVLHGCSTWDQERLPLDELTERFRSVQKIIRDSSLCGLILYGDVRNYAKICYFTNYIPKHSYALLLIPAEGDPCLLAKLAGIRDIPYVQTMTWVKDIRPVKNLADEVEGVISETMRFGSDNKIRQTIGICGKDIMPISVFCEIKQGSNLANLEDMNSVLDQVLMHKRPREISVMRVASDILRLAEEEMKEAYRKDCSVVTAAIEAERIARNHGAQDVRVLYSLDFGNTLQPLETLSETRNDPMIAYIAVEFLGYWSEGMVTLTEKSRPIHNTCESLLDFFTRSMKDEAEIQELLAEARQLIKPYYLHPLAMGGFGHNIGLSLQEKPYLHSSFEHEKIKEKSVYSVHACLTNQQGENCLLSSMILINQHGNEILWSSLVT